MAVSVPELRATLDQDRSIRIERCVRQGELPGGWGILRFETLVRFGGAPHRIDLAFDPSPAEPYGPGSIVQCLEAPWFLDEPALHLASNRAIVRAVLNIARGSQAAVPVDVRAEACDEELVPTGHGVGALLDAASVTMDREARRAPSPDWHTLDLRIAGFPLTVSVQSQGRGAIVGSVVDARDGSPVGELPFGIVVAIGHFARRLAQRSSAGG